MAEKVNVVQIILNGKNNLKGPLGRARADLGNFQKGITAATGNLKNFAVTSAATFAAGTVAIKGFLDAAAEQEQQIARLNSVLASTEGVVGRTAQEIQDAASALQSFTTFGDEAILRGQNILLTFTQIRGDNFDRATEALVDLTVGLNGAEASSEQLRSQAIQLGKALNDPIAGVGALGKAGVQFTEDQEALIEALVATGDVAAAQVIILEELETQFGGAAAAAANTFSGQLRQTQNILGDVSEDIGFLIQIVGTPFASALRGAAEALKEFTGSAVELFRAARDLQDQFADSGEVLSFADALFEVADAADEVSGSASRFARFIASVGEFRRANPALFEFATTVGKIAAALIPLGTALAAVSLILKPFTGIISGVIGGLQLLTATVGFLLSPTGLLIAAIAGLVALFVTEFPQILKVGEQVLGDLAQGFQNFLAFFTSGAFIDILVEFRDFFIEIFEALLPVITPIFQTLQDVVITAIAFIDNFIRPVIEALVTFFRENFEGIKNIVVGAFEAIAGLISIPISIITGVVRTFLALLRGDFDGALQAVKDTFVNVFNGIVSFIEGFFTVLGNVIALGWEAIKGVFSASLDILGNIVEGGLDFISDAFGSVFDGIKERVFGVFRDIASRVQDFLRLIINTIDSIPGIDVGDIGNFDFGGARQDGGPVVAGRAYLVGEQGPELIVPRSSGTVIPNDELGGAGGGGVTLNINIEGNVDSQDRIQQIADVILRELTNTARLNQLGL